MRRVRLSLLIILAVGIMGLAPGRAAESVKLHAAGSLRSAMTAVIQAFTAATGIEVEPTFGPSGLLRERLAGGEAGHVFASANMTHPQALADAGKAGPVRLFARNELCALTRMSVGVTPETLLDRLMDPTVTVGISTPKADPSGDYAVQLFKKAEAVRPGAEKTLLSKAKQLTGGPDSPKPPPGRNIYAALVADNQADIFLTYCTNAREAVQQVPSLQQVAVPSSLAVGADYGVTVLAGAPEAAGKLVDYLLSAKGQESLAGFGFSRIDTSSRP